MFGTGIAAGLFGAVLVAGVEFLALGVLWYRRKKAFEDVELPKFREHLRTRGRRKRRAIRRRCR